MVLSFPDFTPTMPEFLAHSVRRFGPREMLVSRDGRYTYAQAEQASRRLARGLLAAGVGKGSRVGILMPSNPDFVIAFLAACRVGAVAVPLSTFLKPRELGWCLGHADVQLLLMTDRFLGQDYVRGLEQAAPSLARQCTGHLRLPELPFLRSVWVWSSGGEESPPWACGGAEALGALADQEPGCSDHLLEEAERRVAPADAMLLVYTSGSTADPKGILHTQGTFLRHAYNLNSRRTLLPDDRIYSPMAFFWVGGLVVTLFTALAAGACFLCEERFEPGAALDLIEKERATFVRLQPAQEKALREHPSFPRRDLRSVRRGLECLLPENQRITDPQLRPNWLGMTETLGPHCMADLDRPLPPSLRGSFGPPLEGIEVEVVDPETGRALPAGQMGEIVVRGYSLMQGFYKREREEVFERDGRYRTGDLGHFDEHGHLHFAGRADDVIRASGTNVSPLEVEAVLRGAPGVRDVHVVGLPDPLRGAVVAAAIVPEEGAEIDAEGLRRLARERLSAFKVPRHFVAVRAEDLVTTATGKVRKQALADWLARRIAEIGSNGL